MVENNNGLYSISGAKIIWRNFRGEAQQYNAEGDRNFNVVLTPEQAQVCSDMGLSVKTRPSKFDPDEKILTLKVVVSYRRRQPKIVQITRRKKVYLTEQTVGELDFLDFSNVDISIRASYWSRPSGSGYTAYLNSGYFTLLEDDFEAKYEDIPDGESDADILPL